MSVPICTADSMSRRIKINAKNIQTGAQLSKKIHQLLIC